jgi:hypothetical protein
MNLLRTNGWRIALALSGLVALVAGPMHPDSDAKDPLREELAVMTADERWVPGHSLLVLSTVLLALGLWLAYRSGAWSRRTRRAVKVGAVAFSAYVVETVSHAAAAVDSDALAAGEPAYVAFGHIALAAVLYPVSGLALVYLADSLGRASGGWRRGIAVLGIVGGLVHAVSVPAVVLLPDTEITPLFAASAVLIALWSLATAAAGVPVRAVSADPDVQPVPVS